MSTKQAKYSVAYKSKLVLEVLKNERTLSEIASANNITPKNAYSSPKLPPTFPTVFSLVFLHQFESQLSKAFRP